MKQNTSNTTHQLTTANVRI